jgi:predicted SAM-dependent methyltransferase
VSDKVDALLKQQTRKLHLGCGSKFIPGFFHVDAYKHPNVDVQGPVERLDFIPEDSIDLIYAAHVLEHFGRHEVDAVLTEWRRVLKPGGVLRLSVPDYVACAKLLIDGRLARGIDEILGLMVGGQRDAHDYHKMIFDEASLEARLKKAGFSAMRRWDWRTTEHVGVDDYSQAYLPHMDKANGTMVSLNVEAIK